MERQFATAAHLERSEERSVSRVRHRPWSHATPSPSRGFVVPGWRGAPCARALAVIPLRPAARHQRRGTSLSSRFKPLPAGNPPATVYGYRACPECGAAVQRGVLDSAGHVCAPERYAAHQTMIARRGLERLEEDLAWWLTTPAGKFQAFLAERAGGLSSSA